MARSSQRNSLAGAGREKKEKKDIRKYFEVTVLVSLCKHFVWIRCDAQLTQVTRFGGGPAEGDEREIHGYFTQFGPIYDVNVRCLCIIICAF